ncbi:hypothetical protein [Thalassotalea marina]|uniref:Uncharacterized protein n=1 Tax=Thalassotalea marina TaxID=1673741 RepID=A0A919BN13_9GAMM|nr:hypothetical protein [Thalassotalea marina]GHG01519.1 hypothetical protein GCM10017161_32810 [Thalassotalea marina]
MRSINNIYILLALATCGLLLIPFTASQITAEVDWKIFDYIVMGLLIFGFSSLFVFSSRRVPKNKRVLVGAGLFLLFIYIWLELAVGVFTTLGS